MGVFKTKTTLYGSSIRIPYVAEDIRRTFLLKGFEVKTSGFINCPVIYVAGNSVFRKIHGYATALEVRLFPLTDGNIGFAARACIPDLQVSTPLRYIYYRIAGYAVWRQVRKAGLDAMALEAGERAVLKEV